MPGDDRNAEYGGHDQWTICGTDDPATANRQDVTDQRECQPCQADQAGLSGHGQDDVVGVREREVRKGVDGVAHPLHAVRSRTRSGDRRRDEPIDRAGVGRRPTFIEIPACQHDDAQTDDHYQSRRTSRQQRRSTTASLSNQQGRDEHGHDHRQEQDRARPGEDDHEKSADSQRDRRRPRPPEPHRDDGDGHRQGDHVAEPRGDLDQRPIAKRSKWQCRHREPEPEPLDPCERHLDQIGGGDQHPDDAHGRDQVPSARRMTRLDGKQPGDADVGRALPGRVPTETRVGAPDGGHRERGEQGQGGDDEESRQPARALQHDDPADRAEDGQDGKLDSMERKRVRERVTPGEEKQDQSGLARYKQGPTASGAQGDTASGLTRFNARQPGGTMSRAPNHRRQPCKDRHVLEATREPGRWRHGRMVAGRAPRPLWRERPPFSFSLAERPDRHGRSPRTRAPPSLRDRSSRTPPSPSGGSRRRTRSGGEGPD